MANRFETAIPTEFINYYTPIPFKEMMAAGQMKQQRYDAGAAAQDAAIQRAESIQAIAGTEDDDYRRQAIQKMYEIRDKYVGKDLSDSFVIRQMNNDMNTGIDKEWLQKMQESKAAWDMNQKNRMGLASDNKLNNELDILRDPALANEMANRKRSWNSKDMGTYNYSSRAFTDKASLFKPYYDNINPDVSRIIEEDGYTQQVYGISDNKVKSISEAGAQELASTPQGKDHIDAYRLSHPGTDLNDVQILQKEMYDYGKPFAREEKRVLGASLQRGDSDSGSDGQGNQLDVYARKGAVDSVEGKNPKQKVEAIETEYNTNVEILKTAKPGSAQYIQAQGIKDKYETAVKQAETIAKQEIDPEVNKLRQETFTALRAIPAYKNMSDADINAVIDEHLGDGLSSSIKRFGTAIDNAQDMSAYGVARAGEFAANAVKALYPVVTVNTESYQKAFDSAVGELDTSRPFKFGDIFRVAGNTIKHLAKDNSTNPVTKQIDKEASKDDMNLLRTLALKVDRGEKNIKDRAQEILLNQYQYVSSDAMAYPVITTRDASTNTEYITDDEGKKIAPSYIHELLKNLPTTMEGKEIRKESKKGEYKVLDDKGKKSAQGTFANWDVSGGFTDVRLNDNGDLVLRTAFTPDNDSKSKGALVEKYEIVIPGDSSEADSIIEDYGRSGKIEQYYRLKDRRIHTEVKTYINAKEGHDYKIKFNDGAYQNVNVKPDPNTGKYIVTIKGEQIKDQDGGVYPLTEREVEDYLYSAQMAARRMQ